MNKVNSIFWVFGIVFAISCSNGTDKQASAVQPTAGTEESTGPLESPGRLESTEAAGSVAQAQVKVEMDAFEFGTITEGEKVERTFVLKNVGDAPLIITAASASCGCTTPEFSNKPVAPGQSTSVKTTFDSNGQVGQQHKMILINSNAENGIVQLHLRGEVKAKN